jgi:LacI family transcriptional regulator
MSKPTIKQVAMEAQVSTATVSRVLTGSEFVSEEVKTRVLNAVEKMNYQTNAVARSLKQDKTETIGIIVPDISNVFFMTFSKGLEEVVQGEGYNLIFCSSDEDQQKEGELLLLLQEKRVDALVLATTGGNDAIITKLSRFGIPIILLDRQVEDSESQLDIIAEDNSLGAYLLTKLILESGHKHIGVINGFLDVSTGRDRYEGYKKAMREAGIREKSHLVFDGEFSVDGGNAAIRYFMQLEVKPTAIISFNNNMSFGALQELIRLQMRIPLDIMLASYGVVEAAQLLIQSGIIYVEQTPFEMGRQAGEIILNRLQKDRDQDTRVQNKVIFKPQIKHMN